MKLFVPPDWALPAVFRSRLGEAAGRQQAMEADGHLLLVLHEPPGPGDPLRKGRLFWRDPQGNWKSNNLGEGVKALRKHVGGFADRADELEKQWNAAKTAEDYYALLQAIAPLHCTARHLHATLQQAREMLPDDRDLINLRDQAGDVERAIELLHADAENGLDFTIAHQAEQQAKRSYEMAVAAHRLNLLAATFFPIATLSAIFGMNLAAGFEPWGNALVFGTVLAVGFACGVILAAAIGRKAAPVAKPGAKGQGKYG